MLSRRTTFAVTSLLLSSLALTACSSDDSGNSGDKAKDTGAPTATTDASTVSINSGTPEAKEEKGTGDWAIGTKSSTTKRQNWVLLKRSAQGNVIDGSGLPFYLFKNDSRSPSNATCNNACADRWPPVLLNLKGSDKTRVYAAGVNNARQLVGAVKRADGTFQLTLNGWPLYRFSEDTRANDLKGQGEGGKWFAINANGTENRALKNTGGGNTGGNTGGGNTGGGDTQQPTGRPGALTLLDEPNDTSESNPAQRVSGTGCLNVGPDNTASAVRDLSGQIKIWSERDCKGESKTVTNDILDLATIDFDNKISSVFFG